MLKTAQSVSFTVTVRISTMNTFKMDCRNGLSKCPKNPESFENVFVTVLDRHAPRKTKILHRNQKPQVGKNFREAIMKRSELKSMANTKKRPKDISDSKKQ